MVVCVYHVIFMRLMWTNTSWFICVSSGNLLCGYPLCLWYIVAFWPCRMTSYPIAAFLNQRTFQYYSISCMLFHTFWPTFMTFCLYKPITIDPTLSKFKVTIKWCVSKWSRQKEQKSKLYKWCKGLGNHTANLNLVSPLPTVNTTAVDHRQLAWKNLTFEIHFTVPLQFSLGYFHSNIWRL